MSGCVFRSASGRFLAALSVVLCAANAATAEIVIEDNWADTGQTVVRGADWTVSVAKNDGALALCRGGQTVRLVPLAGDGNGAQGVETCTVSREGADVRVEVAFTAGGQPEAAAFHLSERGLVTVAPGAGLNQMAVECPIAVGILPGDLLEDVLYDPEAIAGEGDVIVPSENWFACLVQGGDAMLACAWPDSAQRLSLRCPRQGDAGAFPGFAFSFDGKPCYLELLTGTALWHRQGVELEYLERAVPLEWRPPHPAQYRTQLWLRGETSARRTFTFLNGPNEQWRPEVGAVSWPVWFENGVPMMRLSKKIPPKGDAIIYPFCKGDETLMSFLERTPVAGIILDRNKLAPLPHGSRDAKNVGFIACAGTLVMRSTVFALGLQRRERDFLSEYADFLADYVDIIQKRNAGLLESIARTHAVLDTWRAQAGDSPEMAAYLDGMIEFADETEAGVQRKLNYLGGDSPEAHMREAARIASRLKELVATDGTEVFPECDMLVGRLNCLSWGHIEMTGGRFSMMGREWAQEAAFGCARVPAAAAYAAEIRAAIRQALTTGPAW
ncbi:MAG: hypothetical protein JXR94_24930 [Candidatus Hydrogenedentes bacterium]|nr:hypothetical protein [Candidatus Hydrogenedentota bacterium]